MRVGRGSFATLACDNRRIEHRQLSEDFKVLENNRCA